MTDSVIEPPPPDPMKNIFPVAAEGELIGKGRVPKKLVAESDPAVETAVETAVEPEEPKIRPTAPKHSNVAQVSTNEDTSEALPKKTQDTLDERRNMVLHCIRIMLKRNIPFLEAIDGFIDPLDLRVWMAVDETLIIALNRAHESIALDAMMNMHQIAQNAMAGTISAQSGRLALDAYKAIADRFGVGALSQSAAAKRKREMEGKGWNMRSKSGRQAPEELVQAVSVSEQEEPGKITHVES